MNQISLARCKVETASLVSSSHSPDLNRGSMFYFTDSDFFKSPILAVKK